MNILSKQLEGKNSEQYFHKGMAGSNAVHVLSFQYGSLIISQIGTTSNILIDGFNLLDKNKRKNRIPS